MVMDDLVNIHFHFLHVVSVADFPQGLSHPILVVFEVTLTIQVDFGLNFGKCKFVDNFFDAAFLLIFVPCDNF